MWPQIPALEISAKNSESGPKVQTFSYKTFWECNVQHDDYS